MSDEDDWRRRFTEQDVDEEEDYSPRRRSAPAAPESAADDDSNQIRVVADEHGRIADVIVPENWRDEIEHRSLGQTLMEKANEALAKRVTEQVEALDADGDPAPVYGHRDAPSAHGDLDGPVATELLNEVMELFARYDADLAAYTAQVRQVATAKNSGESPSGKVVVTIGNGQVTGVTVDSMWGMGARHTEIRSEALAAFQAAWRRAETAGAGAVQFPPSIARLHELASDPEALSRQLGMTR